MNGAIKQICVEDLAKKPVLVEAVIRQLQELHKMLSLLSDTQYQATFPFETNASKAKASVGQHTRHVVEFIDKILNNLDQPLINYDLRDRNKDIESSVGFAQRALVNLQQRVEQVADYDLKNPIKMTEAVHVEREVEAVGSTIGREIMFAVSHTEHHFALIAERCDSLGICVPDDFGKAISTRRHELTLK